MEPRAQLRLLVRQVLDAFVAALVREHRGQPIGARELESVARALEKSTVLDPELDRVFEQIRKEMTLEFIRSQRRDPFRRLIVHPLSEYLKRGELSREILPNYMNFIHLVLGDEAQKLAKECVEVCEELKVSATGHWDGFYDDARAQAVIWTVLARIAEAFKRFDMRRDWFIGLMQQRRHALSLASNMFQPIPQHPRNDEGPFGVEQFTILFAALFGPMRDLLPNEEAAFERHIGASPEHVFGAIWQNLEKLGARL